MSKGMRDACAKIARDAQASWVACSAPIQAATAERIAAAIEDLPDDASADRIAELERAAATSRAEHAAEVETLRQHLANGASLHERSLEESIAEHDGLLAEHAAALGLATARIRELEGERDELLGLLLEDQPAEDCSFWDMDGCADGKCWHCRRRAIVARIEKVTKGTT